MFSRGVRGSRHKKFVFSGNNDGLSPEEYGIMAVGFSIDPTKKVVKEIRGLRHATEETSLIYHISKNRNFAIANFLAMGTAACVSYAAINLRIPEKIKPLILRGVRSGMENVGGDSEALLFMFDKYLSTILFDVQIGDLLRLSGTETHRMLVRNLAQSYSGRQDLDDLEGVDSVTLAPITEHFYMSMLTYLRETARLKFV